MAAVAMKLTGNSPWLYSAAIIMSQQNPGATAMDSVTGRARTSARDVQRDHRPDWRSPSNFIRYAQRGDAVGQLLPPCGQAPITGVSTDDVRARSARRAPRRCWPRDRAAVR